MQLLALVSFLILLPAAALHAGSYDPAWAEIVPMRTIALVPRPGAGDAENGAIEDCVKGSGLADFSDLSWDASRHDATPAAGAPFDHADPRHWIATDFKGKPRGQTSGALAR